MTSGVDQTTQAESAVMAKTAARFENVSASLQDMLTKLMNELSVLQTAWVGRGGRQFEAVKTQYQHDLNQLNKALLETAVAIKESGVSYDSSDDSAADRITKSGGSYSLPL